MTTYNPPINNPVPPMNFILDAFQSEVTLDLCGNIYSEMVAALDVSAVAIMYMKTSSLKSTFLFESDSTEFTDLANTGVRYFVNSDSWPLYNPANAMLDIAGLSQNPIATVDGTGASFQRNKMLVAHDFVRYLAQQLFNTHFGVELFNNEVELLQSVRRACDDSAAGHTLFDLLQVLKNVDINKSGNNPANMLGPDPSGYWYMDNDVTDPTNICRAIFEQMIDPSGVNRFSDIISGITTGPAGVAQSLPFIDGDSLSYKLIIHPADGQENLVGLAAPFGSRSFEIRIVLVADDQVVDPTDPASLNTNVDVAELADPPAR